MLVEEMIRKSISDLGGIGRFVSPGDRILVKPNLLVPRRPDEAITTHPEVLRAVIRLVKEAGGVAVVGDSPAGRSTQRILKHLAERTGIAAVCDEEGAEFVFFTESAKVPFPEGVVAKSFDLTSTLADVDGIISIAKLKTHSFTRFTGAVKNLFGLVYGLKKAEYHLRMKDPESFSEMLVDLAECVKPRLTIIDGVVGMDGNGPSAGRVKPVGLIMASSDVHALDAVALEVVGEPPRNVRTIDSAVRRGLLKDDPLTGIHVVGGQIDGVRVKDFRMPPKIRVFGGIPGVIGGLVAEGVARKPVIVGSRCVGCGECVDICPAEALAKADDVAGSTPKVLRDACIRCYCCQEVCPESAIDLRRMPVRSLARALTKRLRRGAEN